MLKAYIIKSRVRVAENLLIVQPYSPHLFRQGVNPGPQLLLNVLTKKMSEKEAKAEWKRLAKKTKRMLQPLVKADSSVKRFLAVDAATEIATTTRSGNLFLLSPAICFPTISGGTWSARARMPYASRVGANSETRILSGTCAATNVEPSNRRINSQTSNGNDGRHSMATQFSVCLVREQAAADRLLSWSHATANCV